MNHVQELENRIRMAVQLDSMAPSGFHPIHCPICQAKEKKGGFKFESNQIVYHCFRMKCDASCVYTEGEYVSKRFRKLMEEIGVEIPIETLYANKQSQSKIHTELNDELFEEFYPKEIKEATKYFPDNLIPLDAKKHPIAFQYLLDRRLPEHFDYYVSDDYRWVNRLIVPSYFNGKLTGLIGRDFSGSDRVKYMTCSEKNMVYFREGKITPTVYVFEGPLDAIHCPGGVALCSDSISKKTAYLLSKAKRVVFVAPRDNPKFVTFAKKYGWEVCIPEWGNKCKDLNEAIQEYGIFVPFRRIHNTTTNDYYEAELRMKLWQGKK